MTVVYNLTWDIGDIFQKISTQLSYGAMTWLFNTPLGKSSSPNAVVCAHGFSPFSLRIVPAKHEDHPWRGKFFVTLSIVPLWTNSAWSPRLSWMISDFLGTSLHYYYSPNTVASWINSPRVVIFPVSAMSWWRIMHSATLSAWSVGAWYWLHRRSRASKPP